MQSDRFFLRIAALAAVAAAVAGVALSLPAMPQDPLFHAFADSRTFCGLDNFWNVASNLPFALFGLSGLAVTVWRRRGADEDQSARLLPLACFFTGVALVSAGSAYYHSAPDNGTLFWDRLPMTVAFGALLATMLADRVHVGFAVRAALPGLMLAGLASLLYWQWSEARGVGDLRPYLLLQALPMLLSLALIGLFPRARLLPTPYLLAMLLFYAAAMACERLDWEVYQALNGAISGHSIKHTLAALATGVPLLALMRNRPGAPVDQPPRISSSCSPNSATQGRQPTSQLS